MKLAALNFTPEPAEEFRSMIHDEVDKKISQKVDFSLVSGAQQWCDPGPVRFFSILFTLRLRLLQQWG
jgi:hypothetical protein